MRFWAAGSCAKLRPNKAFCSACEAGGGGPAGKPVKPKEGGCVLCLEEERCAVSYEDMHVAERCFVWRCCCSTGGNSTQLEAVRSYHRYCKGQDSRHGWRSTASMAASLWCVLCQQALLCVCCWYWCGSGRRHDAFYVDHHCHHCPSCTSGTDLEHY
jgi:hypothetical protein